MSLTKMELMTGAESVRTRAFKLYQIVDRVKELLDREGQRGELYQACSTAEMVLRSMFSTQPVRELEPFLTEACQLLVSRGLDPREVRWRQ